MEALHPRRVLAASATLVSLSAFGGAAGLAFGFGDLGPELNSRLPLASPVLGGVALALVIGVPFALLAVMAWHDHPDADPVALLLGVGLMMWIAVQLAFLRQGSFLHVASVLAGAAFAMDGLRARLGLPAWHDDHVHPHGLSRS
jgi:hypothetical protein